MSKRTERVSKAIKHELGDIIIKDIKDDNLKFLTITRVEVAPDLRTADIYFTTINNDPKIVMKSLVKAKGVLKLELVKRIRLKYTPDLKFYEDKGLEYSLKINRILDEITKDKDNNT